MRVGPDGIEPPTASMWTRRSAAELWTNDRGTGDAVPRRRRVLDHPALRNRVIAAKHVARAEGLEPSTLNPGFGDRHSDR